MSQAGTTAKRPRASIRVGILPEKTSITGCWWTVAPPDVIKYQAMKWAEKRYSKKTMDSGKNYVFVETPGMLTDVIVGFSRIKLGMPPDRA